jgi:protein SCO1/2
MMLGVQYRERSDGMFEHSNLVTVLDTKGQIGKRIEGLGQPMEEASAYIKSVYETGEK